LQCQYYGNMSLIIEEMILLKNLKTLLMYG
jgi:hypothetical protein